MKGLTIGCYAIAFGALSLAMILLMQQTSINANSLSQFSVKDFSALAR